MDSIEQNKYNDILKQIVSEIKSTRVAVGTPGELGNDAIVLEYWQTAFC